MLKIAICDDEKPLCEQMKLDIVQILNEKGVAHEIDLYHSAESFINSVEERPYYDVLFLDIEMGNVNGVELGKHIRYAYENEMTKIIFISWNVSYAMDLFQIRPFDFIPKPFTKARLEEIFEMLLKVLAVENDAFAFTYNGKLLKVPSKEILYFESKNRKIYLHTIKTEYVFYSKLDELMEKLDGRQFWRIHKSIIINYMLVEKFEYTSVTMIDGSELSISQQYRSAVRINQRDMLKMGYKS